MITFHKMTVQDLDAVSDMESRIFSMPWSREAYQRALLDPNVCYVAAKEGTVLAGSCGVRNILSDGEITNVMVDEPYRGRGIGRAMLQKLLVCGKEMGAVQFFLEVRCSNEPALRLYRSCGFEVEGVRKNLYSNPTENGYVMWKR